MKVFDATTTLKPTNRLYGFDSLRAVAVLLVVALHALVPYVSTPMPGLLWVTEQQSGSPVLNGIFWGIACCIMPLFFCISGYFSYQLFERRGSRSFLSHRVRRILLPLTVAVVIILPLEVYLWTLGTILHKGYPWKTLTRLNFYGEVRSQFWGLSHLWYLQYLFLYGVIFVSYERFRSHRSSALRHIYQLVTSGWLPLVLLVPCATILYFEPQTMIGFQHSPLPVLSKFLFNGLFFAIGLMAARDGNTLAIWKRYSVLFLTFGMFLLPAMVYLINQSVTENSITSMRITLAVVVTLFSCMMTFGSIGIVQKQQQQSHFTVSYLSESSFFLYLIHHPLVAILHMSLAKNSLSADVKFVITFCSVITLSLLMYQVAVRNTWIGVLLNGRKMVTVTKPISEISSDIASQKAA